MKHSVTALCLSILSCLGLNTVVATADDGSLGLNEQAIYDDGYQTERDVRSYGSKNIFLPEMESKNSAQKKQADQPVKQANKAVFTSQTKDKQKNEQHNQQVLRKYLFTAKSKKFTNLSGSTTPKSDVSLALKYVWLGVIFSVMALLGGYLGQRFARRHFRRKEER